MPYSAAPLVAAARAAGDIGPAPIARRLNVSYHSVYRWLSGTGAPTLAAAAAIERTYGVTAAQMHPDDDQ